MKKKLTEKQLQSRKRVLKMVKQGLSLRGETHIREILHDRPPRMTTTTNNQ